jgi:hypothetical protein
MTVWIGRTIGDSKSIPSRVEVYVCMVLSYGNNSILLDIYEDAYFHHVHYTQSIIARSNVQEKGDIVEFEQPSRIYYAIFRLSDTAKILNMITLGC